MNPINEAVAPLTPKSFRDSMVRLVFIAVLAYYCVQAATPFISLLVWGAVLATMLYPLHQKLARKVGGKQGLASGLMILVVMLVIVPPLVLLSGSFVDEIRLVREAYQSDGLQVDMPDPSVKEWPVIGERAYAAWESAATNLPDFVKKNASHLEKLAGFLFRFAADAVGAIGFFTVAFIVAGIMMAFGGAGSGAMHRIVCRIAGPEQGPGLFRLVVGTIRSVATGVLGVAAIQALLFGVGLVIAGVPMAGLLAIAVLFLGIMQLPATIIAIPVIAWLWALGDGSSVGNAIFTVYFLLAGLADNVLKPMLLGRGVEAPMPVILIGALGGMITAGMIGLFLGAVVLAVGYEVFMRWTWEGFGKTDPQSVPGA